MNLDIIDIIVILAYFLLILYIGLVYTRKKEQKESLTDFILAGRKLTLPIFVASLVATWYGSILGIGEFIYNSGVVAWVCMGLPYYIAALLFGFFAAGKIRQLNFSSIPEQIEANYGKTAGIISSVIMLVITIPAAYILMLGIIFQMLFGLDLSIAIIAGAVISLIYIYTGGFKADLLTNTAQFILMYVGFGILLIFSVLKFGLLPDYFDKIPDSHLSFLGEFNWQYVAAWFIIAFQTFVDPTFHQRCAAAENPKTAKNGVLLSVLFWIVFDFLTLSTGLYAKAFISAGDPLMSFPLLGDAVLPAFWKGLFVVSLLATVMSTLDSYAFVSSITIGRDLLGKISFFKKMPEKQNIRLGLIFTSFLGIMLAIFIPSAVEIIYKTSSIAVPGLIIPLILTLGNKKLLNQFDVIFIMAGSSVVSLIFTIGKAYNYNYFDIFEPMFPGIIFAIFISIILIFKNKYEYFKLSKHT